MVIAIQELIVAFNSISTVLILYAIILIFATQAIFFFALRAQYIVFCQKDTHFKMASIKELHAMSHHIQPQNHKSCTFMCNFFIFFSKIFSLPSHDPYQARLCNTQYHFLWIRSVDASPLYSPYISSHAPGHCILCV